MVDQAIGVVLAIKQLTPEQGWDVLREVSQRTDIKLHHVSELIINWARTGELCADIHTELERQLSQNPQPSQNDACHSVRRSRMTAPTFSTRRPRSQVLRETGGPRQLARRSLCVGRGGDRCQGAGCGRTSDAGAVHHRGRPGPGY
ncbi:ANTAR domain-containing protein [Streptomyces sp. NPDC059378]|uniref:ANTAR domain-containing protein n=1 Tax=Streptomyces sp. NPDC059378 TaxID=3346815 RepID=UPI0036A68F24